MKYHKELEQKKKEFIRKIGKCERCERTELSLLTVDHIIPVEILLLMGVERTETYDEENFAVLCRICNAIKSNRMDFGDKRTKPLLLKYLNRI